MGKTEWGKRSILGPRVLQPLTFACFFSPHGPADSAAEADKTWHYGILLCAVQNSAWPQLLHGRPVAPDGEYLLPPSAAPKSHSWVGGLGGDWALGLFPFRKCCSASVSMECSRKVNVQGAPSSDALLLPPLLGPLWEPSQHLWSLPFSSYSLCVFQSPLTPPWPVSF